jgi:hypothetical protein
MEVFFAGPENNRTGMAIAAWTATRSWKDPTIIPASLMPESLIGKEPVNPVLERLEVAASFQKGVD